MLWFLLLCGFVVLSVFAAAHDRFPADLWLAHRLQDADSSAFVTALDSAEDLADSPISLFVGFAGVVLLLAASLRSEALVLLSTVLSSPINVAIKELVDRPRPAADLIRVGGHPSGSSFPSGHADSVLVLYGLLFYLITLFVGQPALRLVGQVACLWVILFTGMERVYNGAHWPSDVLGGYYIGGLMLATLIALHRRLRPAPEAVTGDSQPRY